MDCRKLRKKVAQLQNLKLSLKGERKQAAAAGDAGTSLENMPDEALMAHVQQSDKAAYRILVERHISKTVALAARFVQGRSDAEDIAQEVFLAIWKNSHQWTEGKAAFSTWLYRVTVNRAIDFKRRSRFEPLEQADEPEDERPDALARIHAGEVSARLRAALTSLSEPQQIAMALYYHEGLSAARCAEVMEMNVNAVESLLKRGRRKLREIMQSGREGGAGGMPLGDISLF